jgi:6-phosphogluconolactonase
MTTYRIRVADDGPALARLAAGQIASHLDLALSQRDRALLALAGGETPKAAYRLLGQEHLPWERVDVLLGDERWVSANDAASNARMLSETLLAQPPGSTARFHPIPTETASPVASASAYADLLAGLGAGAPPRFDLILLGLGDDGHTASLFPGTAAPEVRDQWVTVGEGKGLPRITFTAPLLSAARQVIFLVSGAGKRQALGRLLDPDEPSDRTPARLVQPDGEVLILADREAATGLA